MDDKVKTQHAREIVTNPLWELMKAELPAYYYRHFRVLAGADRERVAMAHDIFDDMIKYIELQMGMGEILEFPTDESETINDANATTAH